MRPARGTRRDAALAHRANTAIAHSTEHIMGARPPRTAVEAARAQVAAPDRRRSRGKSCSPPAPPKPTTSPSRAPPATPGSHGDPTRRRVVTLATEHSCVLASVADLARATDSNPMILPVDHGTAMVDPDGAGRDALAHTHPAGQRHGRANNEIGPDASPSTTLAAMTHSEAGALFHTDAAQAVGKHRHRCTAGIDLAFAQRPQAVRPQGHRRAVRPPPSARAPRSRCSPAVARNAA